MALIRVAVVGTGILGARHARVFHEQPESELAAVADIDQPRAQRIGELYGVKSYADFHLMLRQEAVDAVAVATPDFLHHEPVIAAMRAGKHVLVEKPLATTAAEAREIARVASETGVTAMVNFSQRFLNDYLWIKQRIDAGDIGRPVMVNSIKFDTISVPTQMIAWADQTSPFFFMSSHDLDLIHWYLGADPVEVVAHEARGVLASRGIATHDGLNALIQFAGGISAHFHSSWIHPNTYPVVADGTMQIIGTEGAITYANRSRRAELYNAQGGQEIVFTGPQTATEVDGKLAGAFTDSVRHFLSCVAEHREPMTSPRRVLITAETLVAVLESARRGQPIRIPVS